MSDRVYVECYECLKRKSCILCDDCGSWICDDCKVGDHVEACEAPLGKGDK